MPTSLTYLDAILKSRIASHASFWILMVILLAYHGSLFGGGFQENLISMCVLLPVQMVAAYLLIYVQIPRWLFKRYWILFTFSFINIAYLLAVLARLSIIYISEPLTGYEGIDESLWEVLTDPGYLIKVYMTTVYFPAFIFLFIKMTKERFAQENQLIRLGKEKSTTELNFLKAQMNPHFLFNTLNNIYALSKSKSEQTSDMILKLSDLLDYTIYECKEDRVPVIKEWELIENYADLQAIRQNDQLMISIDQHIDNEETQIAPLILISLVENAFKHSFRSAKNSTIKVLLKVEQNILTFEVFNTKSAISKKETSNKKGIGVQNVKRQLALQYPNRHTLHINDQPDSYEIILSIQL